MDKPHRMIFMLSWWSPFCDFHNSSVRKNETQLN